MEEVTVYSVPAVILFCAKNNNSFAGDQAAIIARAFRKAERCGIGLGFEADAATEIFKDYGLRRWFCSQAVSDYELMTVGMNGLAGRCDLSILAVLLGIFGVNVPEEVAEVVVRGDFDNLSSAITHSLKAKGVDWEEGWLKFEAVQEDPATGGEP